MVRWGLSLCVIGLALALPAAAAPQQSRFVMPQVYAQGTDPETAAAFQLLLSQEIRRAAPGRFVGDRTPDDGARPCADPRCGAGLVRRHAVDHALVCTLTRLGAEHVAVLTCVDGSGNIVWTHRASARRPEDLSEIAWRFGEAAATSELPKATQTRRSRRNRDAGAGGDSLGTRRSSLSQGPRFGSVHPSGDSYAGVDRMMSFAWVWRHQTPSFAVEAIPVLGLAWGGSLAEDGAEARDWSILDLFVHWAPIQSDFAPVVGAGIGLHGVRLQQQSAAGVITQNALDVSLSAGVGVILFRSYDFQVALDTRYHLTLDRFSSIDGNGAHGMSFCFGLQRR